MNDKARLFPVLLVLPVLAMLALLGCTPAATTDAAADSSSSADVPAVDASADLCPVTEPEWITPPDDPAVQGAPAPGYYFVNEDRSMWASAWWTGQDEGPRTGDEAGVKVGWFRPEGAQLEIEGERLDGDAPPLEAHVPCCYPTRFQATGLSFPTEGCWRVTARAAESVLTFVVEVEP